MWCEISRKLVLSPVLQYIYTHYIISTNITNRSTNQCNTAHPDASWSILIHPGPGHFGTRANWWCADVCCCLLSLGAQFRPKQLQRPIKAAKVRGPRGKLWQERWELTKHCQLLAYIPIGLSANWFLICLFCFWFCFSTPLHALHCSAVVRFSMDCQIEVSRVKRHQQRDTMWHSC